MIGILLYCLGVMYTPGPVNLLSLNSGAHGRVAAHAPFCLGVGTALCFWFLLIGYTGNAVVSDRLMPVIALAGTCFILYLAWRIISADIDLAAGATGGRLRFQDGLCMQLLNPKSFLAVLPVTTVQFPAVGIAGSSIAMWSFGLALLGVGAPLAYAMLGSTVAVRLRGTRFFRYFNLLMGMLLIVVAVEMAWEHVWLALR